MQLAEGKIAAEDGEPGGAEGIGERDEKRRVAVRSCAVGEDEAIAAGCGRGVEVAANGDCIGRRVQKFAIGGHRVGDKPELNASRR
jgi:hypothetical protein